MNRRVFFGIIASSLAASQAKAVEPKPVPATPVVRANGQAYIVGVAMESVQAGDFVQIQTHGPVRVSV